MKWNLSFNDEKWTSSNLPKEGKYVLVKIASRPELGLPSTCVVGYVQYSAGYNSSPTFITPGVDGKVIAWSDCLPEDFTFGLDVDLLQII